MENIFVRNVLHKGVYHTSRVYLFHGVHAIFPTKSNCFFLLKMEEYHTLIILANINGQITLTTLRTCSKHIDK